MKMNEQRLLIIEDDADIRMGVRILLEGEGYQLDEAVNGMDGLKMLNNDYELIILDIMMPGLSGIETCKKIREISYVPILFLTAKSTETDKLLGLSAGGDDYLVKPFSYMELMARIKALLRRHTEYNTKEKFTEKWIKSSGIEVNANGNEVIVCGRPVSLTGIEYKILLLLISYPNKIFSAQNIFESIWEEEYLYTSANTVMVHMKNLRLKLEKK
ncbi:DNA-binding response regulator [Lachnospiraceae bacterium TWA4]|nr:DNA-binding response regulator [Lachnospiraceae bacterium TWA4]